MSKQNKKQRPLSNCDLGAGANKKVPKNTKATTHNQSIDHGPSKDNELSAIIDSAPRSYNTSSVNPSQNLKSESSTGGKF